MDGSQLRTDGVSLGSELLALRLVSILELSLLAPKTKIRSAVIHCRSSVAPNFGCNLTGPLDGVGEGVLADPRAAPAGRLRGAPGRPPARCCSPTWRGGAGPGAEAEAEEEAAAAAAQRGNKASLHTAAEHSGKPAAGKTTRGEKDAPPAAGVTDGAARPMGGGRRSQDTNRGLRRRAANWSAARRSGREAPRDRQLSEAMGCGLPALGGQIEAIREAGRPNEAGVSESRGGFRAGLPGSEESSGQEGAGLAKGRFERAGRAPGEIVVYANQ